MTFFPAENPDDEVRSLRVAVVGAGIAGLTAAHRLKDAGFQVVVLERQAGAGGRMAVRTQSGIEYNTGARLVYSFSDDLLDLADQVGLTSQMVPAEHSNPVIRSGGADHRAFFAPSPGIIRSPFATLGQVPGLMRIGVELLVRQSRRDPNDLTAGHVPDDETMREYLEKRGLATVGKFLLEPVFRAARGWSLDDISPAFFLSTSAAVWRGKPLTFQDGMGMLTSRLEDRLEVVSGVEVIGIDRGSGHEVDDCTITYQSGGDAQQFKADIVVIAVEGSVAASIIPEPTPAERRWFAAVRYNSGGILHYHVDTQLPAAMRLFGPGENQRISFLKQDRGQTVAPTCCCNCRPKAFKRRSRRLTGRYGTTTGGRTSRPCSGKHATRTPPIRSVDPAPTSHHRSGLRNGAATISRTTVRHRQQLLLRRRLHGPGVVGRCMSQRETRCGHHCQPLGPRTGP